MSNISKQQYLQLKNNTLGAIPLPAKFIEDALKIEIQRKLEEEKKQMKEQLQETAKMQEYYRSAGIYEFKGPNPKFSLPLELNLDGGPKDRLNYLDPLFIKAKQSLHSTTFFKEFNAIESDHSSELQSCRIESKNGFHPDDLVDLKDHESSNILYSLRVYESDYGIPKF